MKLASCLKPASDRLLPRTEIPTESFVLVSGHCSRELQALPGCLVLMGGRRRRGDAWNGADGVLWVFFQFCFSLIFGAWLAGFLALLPEVKLSFTEIFPFKIKLLLIRQIFFWQREKALGGEEDWQGPCVLPELRGSVQQGRKDQETIRDPRS